MVQLVKRMVKYRSSAYPELLFVHDWLLTLACRRAKLTPEGSLCDSLEESLYKARKRRQRVYDSGGERDAVLLGAPKPITNEEEAAVLWSPGAVACANPASMRGLPYLLGQDRTMADDGWPVFADTPEEQRAGCILHALGVEGPLGAGKDGVAVTLQKFVRADLPVRDTLSCTQCLTQTRKNNEWAIVNYKLEGEDQVVKDQLYICHFLFFVRAELCGVGIADAPAAAPLKLGVARVYECEGVSGAGVRPADPAINMLHEFVRVPDLTPDPVINPGYTGLFALDLRTIDSQVVPTKEVDGSRCFAIASKLSGRTAGVKR